VTPQLKEFPLREMRALTTSTSGAIATALDLDVSGHVLSSLGASLAAPLAALLPNLRALNLSENRLSEFPVAALALPYLQTLNLSRNALQSSSLAALSASARSAAALPPLVELDLSRCQLTRFPAELRVFSATLQRLFLSENRIAAIAAEELGCLPALLQLRLDGNALSTLPDAPAVWRRGLGRLQLLFLQNNQLAQIPLCIALLPALNALQIDGNPQRAISHTVQSRGTPALLEHMRNKIPQSVRDAWNAAAPSDGSDTVADEPRAAPPAAFTAAPLRKPSFSENKYGAPASGPSAGVLSERNRSGSAVPARRGSAERPESGAPRSSKPLPAETAHDFGAASGPPQRRGSTSGGSGLGGSESGIGGSASGGGGGGGATAISTADAERALYESRIAELSEKLQNDTSLSTAAKLSLRKQLAADRAALESRFGRK
jgi:uncharacterized membrane protein YgcG